jgi:three-Cys-motif partner protein
MIDKDGLIVDEVGAWAKEKHERLRKYIVASSGARRKYLPPKGEGTSYIDLYSGSGRARIRETEEVIDGSPVVAFKCARDCNARFSEIHLADADPERRSAAVKRIAALRGFAFEHEGTAEDAVKKVCDHINPYGLHFAFLDPFNLQDLPFAVIAALARLNRMDLLIHVSAQDLQRNLERYTAEGDSRLETFAPGWRKAIDLSQSQSAIRAAILRYWRDSIAKLGITTSDGVELVSGDRNQRLYWLVFASRNEFAKTLWEDIRNISGQRQLF